MQPVRLKRTTVANTAYTVLATDVYVGLTSVTASRVFTLPSAAAFGAGCLLYVVDESGSLSTLITLTITRAGSDTINGTATLALNSAYANAMLVSDGVSKWTRIT